MKNYIHCILAVCFCLCILLSACSSGDSAPTEDGAMTALRDASGTVTGYERRYHNADGALSRLDQYDAQQNYLSFVLYGYDDDGRLFTETFYAADGIAQSRTVYSYDDDGRLIEKAYELPNGEATVERYDADSSVIEKLYYDAEEKLVKREVLENGAWHTYEGDALTADQPTEA